MRRKRRRGVSFGAELRKRKSAYLMYKCPSCSKTIIENGLIYFKCPVCRNAKVCRINNILDYVSELAYGLNNFPAFCCEEEGIHHVFASISTNMLPPVFKLRCVCGEEIYFKTCVNVRKKHQKRIRREEDNV
ncbi:MAG: hypothetical protein N3D84_02365 [Candidatus Woesearchaeota archaeon]|nr:hypothetical protein [Candidatus Woesearchaeota archaeon]